MKHIKLFENFLNEWESKDVYDDKYSYSHAEGIGGMYNGFNYHQMQKLMFDTSQFFMTLVAIDKLSKEDHKYDGLADEGMALIDPMKEFADIVGDWKNRKGQTYASKSNHYKNIVFAMNQLKKEMSEHDRLVIKDIPTDIRVTFKSLVDIYEFFRDASLEKDFGDEEVTPEKLDLDKLDKLITKIIAFIDKLSKSDLNK